MLWRRRTYLDYASGANGNPSSPHEEGRREKKKLEDAREAIARLAEVKPDDVIFTGGATEANNIAIRGLAKPGTHMLYLPSAHASIVETMKALEKQGVEVEALPIKDGRVDVEKMRKILRSTTSLISMDAVCGETGTVWNTRDVKNAAPNVLLHVDASQAPLTQKITRSHFGADLLVFDSSKVGGPRGAGCLIVRRTIDLAPVITGGGQERGLRSGTENVEAIAGFALALSAAVQAREAFASRAPALRTSLSRFITSSISNVYINEGAQTVPNILNISLPGRDTDYIVALLDEAGFAVSTRSACETDSTEGSRSVMVLTGDVERAKATMRISWGPKIGERELREFARALAEQIAFVDSTAGK